MRRRKRVEGMGVRAYTRPPIAVRGRQDVHVRRHGVIPSRWQTGGVQSCRVLGEAASNGDTDLDIIREEVFTDERLSGCPGDGSGDTYAIDTDF